MEAQIQKHPVLNMVLTVLNVSLEVVLTLIVIGFFIGLYGILS